MIGIVSTYSATVRSSQQCVFWHKQEGQDYGHRPIKKNLTPYPCTANTLRH